MLAASENRKSCLHIAHQIKRNGIFPVSMAEEFGVGVVKIMRCRHYHDEALGSSKFRGLGLLLQFCSIAVPAVEQV